MSSQSGFTGSVTLSASGQPARTTTSFSTNPVTGGSGNSTLKIVTNRKTAAGTYTITITGVSGSLTHSVTVSLIVQ